MGARPMSRDRSLLIAHYSLPIANPTMSHFTAIRTQLKDPIALQKALADLGFSQIEVHETAQPLYGYQGDRRSDTAEIIVRRQ
ncbi:MAG: hypothetical protein HC881_20020, partial [Leptolyngbyaceae cyanobacterium SL_7_1]|nr:hypothetical protein [Leptolyngbyaceae cyanobacterium SL_7_1]